MESSQDITRYADMFTAMGTESRLRIMQLLLSAHPEGLVVGRDYVGARNLRLDALASSGKTEA